MPQPRIAVVTGNDDKWAEISSILTRANIQRVNIDLPELQGMTVADVAREKCLSASKAVDNALADYVLVEDVGLCFDAFGGALPGPYIKWFVKQLGPSGIARLLDGFSTREATAVCVYAMCPCGTRNGDISADDVILFEGRVRGTITLVPRSVYERQFGWDPIFQPNAQPVGLSGVCPEVPCTYAEMSRAAKDQVSHRRKALDLLQAYLTSETI
mgnify:CR=1 FL=1